MRQCQKPASASEESIAFSFALRLVTCHRDPTTRVQMATESHTLHAQEQTKDQLKAEIIRPVCEWVDRRIEVPVRAILTCSQTGITSERWPVSPKSCALVVQGHHTYTGGPVTYQ